MHRFWDVVIKPLMEGFAPNVVVEVGANYGQNTAHLIEFCRSHGAALHVIDPRPRFNEADWVNEEKEQEIIVHRTLSLNALSGIDHVDAVLIDGDHNWYTVLNELRLIEKGSRKSGSPFPLVLLHDIGWPYGRRDQYYEPNNIPEAHRHAITKSGLLPNKAEPTNKYGIGTEYWKSIYENNVRNGVLTAIEDFLEESERPLDFVSLPGIHGLGIVADARIVDKSTVLTELLGRMRSVAIQRSYIDVIENDRLIIMAAADRAKIRYRNLKDFFEARSQDDSRSIELLKRQVETTENKITDLLETESTLLLEINRKENDLTRARDDLKSRAEADMLLRTKLSQLEKQLGLLSDRSETHEHNLRCFEESSEVFRKRLEFRLADVEMLSMWFDQIEQSVNSLVCSHRWRIGNGLAKVFRKATFRPRVGTNIDEIQDLTRRYRKWRRKYIHANRQVSPLKETLAPNGSSVQSAVGTSSRPSPTYQQPNVTQGDIIVCIHNAHEDTKRCLESIARRTNLHQHHLILVDDGSDMETARFVVQFASRHSSTLIRNDVPVAYTRAANQGLKNVTGQFAVLLNSDTVVTTGWIERLVECAFSEHDIACVGPLSNAASWQSIPRLTDRDGKWSVNVIQAGTSLDDYSESITVGSHRLFPRVSFINGFCFLITRRALDEIGLLDEENFPFGYGEEDDFCIRATEAGFSHRIADNCYVYHAKSKSYTAKRRQEIVVESKKVLQKKHGSVRVKKLLETMAINEDLLRARLVACAATENAIDEPVVRDLFDRRPVIGWLQPHLCMAGGIRRAIEMTNRLTAWGAEVFLITDNGEKTSWMPIASHVTSFAQAKRKNFDVLIVSDPDVIDPYLRIESQLKINYHLAPYMKYRERGRQLDIYYRADTAQLNIANSCWTKQQVEDHSDIRVVKIIAGGIDPFTFHPVKSDIRFDVACMGSKRKHKGTETIEEASSGLRILNLSQANLEQNELAKNICSSLVFASACWHEGFSFCPLEAMACGVPVAMTDDGGSREYAIDGENALVVEVGDAAGLSLAIRRLLTDGSMRMRLIENGMKTARRFNWDRMTADLVDLISDKLE